MFADSETIERRPEAAIAQAVVALGRPELSISDFVPLWELLARWRESFRFVTKVRIEHSVDLGHLYAVTAPGRTVGGRWRRELRYIHVPFDVLTTNKEDVVRRWLWPGGIAYPKVRLDITPLRSKRPRGRPRKTEGA